MKRLPKIIQHIGEEEDKGDFHNMKQFSLPIYEKMYFSWKRKLGLCF